MLALAIAFSSNRNLTGENADANQELFLFDTTTNTFTQVTTATGSAIFSGSPTINAAGTRIAFLSNADLTGENPDGNREVFLATCLEEDTTPPVITVSANHAMLWPPNGRLVPVTVSGTMTDEPGGSGVNASSAGYMILDEYGQIQPRGSITLGANGRYTVTVSLEASRRGNDRDGRHYTIIVSAKDNLGNPVAASTIVTVPHDQGK